MEIYLFGMIALIAFVIIISIVKVTSISTKWLSENWYKLVLGFMILCLVISLIVNTANRNH